MRLLNLTIKADEEILAAYLINAENELYLFKGENEEDLRKALAPISKKLQIPIK